MEFDIAKINLYLDNVFELYPFTAIHFFFEDGVGYIVVRRTHSFILQNWYMFEQLFKRNINVETLYTISYEELSAEELAKVKQKALVSRVVD